MVRRQKNGCVSMSCIATAMASALLCCTFLLFYTQSPHSVDQRTTSLPAALAKNEETVSRRAVSTTQPLLTLTQTPRVPTPVQQEQPERQEDSASSAPTQSPLDVDRLSAEVERLRERVLNAKRALAAGKFMETDPAAVRATTALQDATRKLLAVRYGEEPYRVALRLQFPESMPGKQDAQLVVELAPAALMPHAVHTFLDSMVEDYKGGAFHRAAAHVLQAMVGGRKKGLAFQEYSAEYPHAQRTLGFAGRPGGPAFYISTIDNTRNHGPGSQQRQNPHEADSCFGKVIEGWDDVVARMKKQPGGAQVSGFVEDAKHHIIIRSTTLLQSRKI